MSYQTKGKFCIILVICNAFRLSVGQGGIIIVTPQPGINPAIVNPNCQCTPIANCADGSGTIDPRVINNPNQVSCPLGQRFCCNIINPLTPIPPAGACGIQSIIPFPNFNLQPGQASFSEYPWMAVILGTDNSYVGGGVLIDATTVLTAAHKVATVTIPLKVRLGEYILGSETEPLRAVEVQVVATRINSGYVQANLYNDIAILKLASPVDLISNTHIKTICLPTAGQIFTGQRCWVSGFGASSFVSGVYSQVMREVDLPILDGNACQATLQQTRLGAAFQLNQQSFLCAGGENGKDACTGDGGSPLVCNNGGQWFLAGLVSWGIGCGLNGIPAAYVNIPQMINWIQANRF